MCVFISTIYFALVQQFGKVIDLSFYLSKINIIAVILNLNMHITVATRAQGYGRGYPLS